MEIWEKRLIEAGFKELINPAVDILKTKTYPCHNYNSTLERLNLLVSYLKNVNSNIILAALYKDVCFLPTLPPKRSEERAKELLNEIAKSKNVYNKNVELAGDLILNTSHDWKLVKFNVECNDLAVLLDVDALYYGHDFTVFENKQKLLAKEQIGDFNNANILSKEMRAQARYFEKLLNVRGSIFHTLKAYAKHEKAAKLNIKNFIEKYKEIKK